MTLDFAAFIGDATADPAVIGHRPGVGAEGTAAQLAACAALWEQSVPGGRGRAWERRWRSFPRLLVVLVGTAAAGVRGAVADLRLAAEENPAVAELLAAVPAGAARIEDLVQRGPSAPVWRPLSMRGGPPRRGTGRARRVMSVIARRLRESGARRRTAVPAALLLAPPLPGRWRRAVAPPVRVVRWGEPCLPPMELLQVQQSVWPSPRPSCEIPRERPAPAGTAKAHAAPADFARKCTGPVTRPTGSLGRCW